MAIEHFKKLKWWQHLLFFPLSGLWVYILLMKTDAQKKEEQEKEKAFFRNFRIEIKKGLLWDTKIIVQREKPLTDDEMKLMYKESAS
ncbi:MAG: hypothetical protein WC026_13090 [Hyphomicrobium sp.]|uniref:hypothetical protein n=1 Tax=Hyphomicrobium sp. TaxID=82 RepID=UPI003567F1DA